jgi:hypothetical protein
MATIRALVTLQVGRALLPPGSEVTIDDDESARLIAAGFAESVTAPAAAAAAGSAESEDVQLFRECNAKEAVELIDGTTDAALLAQYRTVEQARKEPRKTVLEALDARVAALAAA